MTKHRSSFVKASLLILASVALFGASSDRSAQTSSRPAPANASEALGLPSPEALATNLLTQLEDVYNRRDGVAYLAMFDRRVFAYEFSPLDKRVGAPDAWDYAHEINAAQKMFADPKTTVVDLKLVQVAISEASAADQVGIDLDGVWKVTASVFLHVEREAADGRFESYRVSGQLHEFYFRRGTEDEGRAWRIVWWRDLTGREPAYTLELSR